MNINKWIKDNKDNNSFVKWIVRDEYGYPLMSRDYSLKLLKEIYGKKEIIDVRFTEAKDCGYIVDFTIKI